jgi:hypothetical protein
MNLGNGGYCSSGWTSFCRLVQILWPPSKCMALWNRTSYKEITYFTVIHAQYRSVMTGNRFCVYVSVVTPNWTIFQHCLWILLITIIRNRYFPSDICKILFMKIIAFQNSMKWLTVASLEHNSSTNNVKLNVQHQ